MSDDPVLIALRAYGLSTHRGRGEYRCRSPFRDNSESDSFTYNTEKGTGHDWVLDIGYNRKQMAERFNIVLPDDLIARDERIPVNDTRRRYRDLKDYAIEQGAEVEYFERVGWKLDQYDNRPCFSFPTATGTRYRFIDGNKPKYKSQVGYKSCWYGLDRAIAMDAEMLVLCNGEASTIVAQRYGVPAFCKTAGEQRIPDNLKDEFALKGFDGQIWIALDCDATGRKQSQEIAAQFQNAIVIDLGLGDKGDLAQFCKLYTHDSLMSLERKLPARRVPKPDIVYAHTAAIDMIESIEMADDGFGLVVPFRSLHALGGYAHIIEPGKLVIVAAPTGGGKTSWLETWADYWIRQGIGGVWRGDEFTRKEYHARRVQRYAGISTMQIRLHKKALWEQKHGVPLDMRHGQPFTAHEISYIQDVSWNVAEWSGKLGYYESRGDKRYLEPTLEIMMREIELRRKAGEVVAFAIFDYLQLLKSQGKAADDNMHEHNLGLIKDWTIDVEIVTIVGSQVTKESEAAAKRGDVQDSYNMQYIRGDKANLILHPRLLYLDSIFTGEGCVFVGKNSDGRAHVTLPVAPDLERLQWLDKSRG